MATMPKSIRRAAEILMRNVVVRKRFPSAFGRRPIFVSPSNNLSILRPGAAKFDAYLFDLVERFVRAGDTVWDVGANMGVFTFAAAHAVGRSGTVVAVEPDPFNLLLLHRTSAIEENGDLRVEIVPVALSQSLGLQKLRIPVRGRSASSLSGAVGSTQMGGTRHEMNIMTLTLDYLLEHFPVPAFLKCDVEGAEHWVLQGAERLLTTARPIMAIELARENADACSAILSKHGYVGFDAHAREPLSSLKPLTQLAEAPEIIAVPREKLAKLGAAQAATQTPQQAVEAGFSRGGAARATIE